MPAPYQYVKIYGKYSICLQQNPITLAWFLYCKNKSLGIQSLGLQDKKKHSSLKALIRYRLRLQDDVSVVALPVYGHICLKVEGGYKVFDFHRKVVTKVLTTSTDADIVVKEIEGVRHASQLAFTPKIQHWSVEERWYEEDFISGSSGYDVPQAEASHLLKIYDRNIASFIEAMILLWSPRRVKVGMHLDETTHFLDDKRLSSSSLDLAKIKIIRSFVKSIVKDLYLERDRQVDLVFSHGDFSVVNILTTENDMRVIDWESVEYRNVLYDFYNYFFTELYYERVKTNLVPEINQAIQSLQSRLVSKAPDIAKTLSSSADLYRRLYYFERIRMLLARELSDNLLDVTVRSIDIFNRYEEALSESEGLP